MLNNRVVAILKRNCKFYKNLDKSKKSWFEKLFTTLLGTLVFEGKGLTVTEEMKVTVSGWAALLISGQPMGAYCLSHVKSVVIHHGHRVDSGAMGYMDGGGILDCKVHFSWYSTLLSIKSPFSSHNLILHEFAHALDQRDRNVSGIPRSLLKEDQIPKWEQYFNSTYIKPTVDFATPWMYFELSRWKPYYKDTRSNEWYPVEAFAVATEKYFLKPRQFNKILPEMFSLLDNFYGQYPLLDDRSSEMRGSAKKYLKVGLKATFDILRKLKI